MAKKPKDFLLTRGPLFFPLSLADAYKLRPAETNWFHRQTGPFSIVVWKLQPSTSNLSKRASYSRPSSIKPQLLIIRHLQIPYGMNTYSIRSFNHPWNAYNSDIHGQTVTFSISLFALQQTPPTHAWNLTYARTKVQDSFSNTPDSLIEE